MSLLPKQSPRFVQLTERRQEFLVCSRVESWVSHWDVEAHRSRKCGGMSCALCAIGSPKTARMIVLAVDGHGKEVLIELRERHRAVAERIEATVTNGEGVRVVARKEGNARNSPVCINILGAEPAFRREIRLLVESLGLPALHMREQLQPEPMNVDDSQVPLKLR